MLCCHWNASSATEGPSTDPVKSAALGTLTGVYSLGLVVVDLVQSYAAVQSFANQEAAKAAMNHMRWGLQALVDHPLLQDISRGHIRVLGLLCCFMHIFSHGEYYVLGYVDGGSQETLVLPLIFER